MATATFCRRACGATDGAAGTTSGGRPVREPGESRAEGDALEVLLAALFGAVFAGSLFAGSRFLASPPKGVVSDQARTMRSALHAATATLPHLRLGLGPETAASAAPHLRALTQASTLALADRDRILAVDGDGADDLIGGPVDLLFEEGRDDRVHVGDSPSGRHLGTAVVAALVVRGERAGSLAAFYAGRRRVRPEDTRMVADAASLVAAQLELASLEEQEKRLAQAELQALRAQISPHFVYNALAAVASCIHTRPDEARELLTDFAEFTRYAFRRQGPYVTLADELFYVEKYLNLERARFGDRLEVRLEVPPEALSCVLPVLALQPLVENAVRHGVEKGRGGRVEIVAHDMGADVRLTVRDDGEGMDAAAADAALAGRGGGIGLSNVDRRMRTSFGEQYGVAVTSSPGGGTEVSLAVPKSHPGVRAA